MSLNVLPGPAILPSIFGIPCLMLLMCLHQILPLRMMKNLKKTLILPTLAVMKMQNPLFQELTEITLLTIYNELQLLTHLWTSRHLRSKLPHLLILPFSFQSFQANLCLASYDSESQNKHHITYYTFDIHSERWRMGTQCSFLQINPLSMVQWHKTWPNMAIPRSTWKRLKRMVGWFGWKMSRKLSMPVTAFKHFMKPLLLQVQHYSHSHLWLEVLIWIASCPLDKSL